MKDEAFQKSIERRNAKIKKKDTLAA